ncbi:hypothetical protein SCP_1503120 [Sparassis crispa]|uniref:Uncharacterized protein n=1 Tax=Sparassis crispa TaxID=139825 RepID=A0A401H4G2_9APHY|nr:hypothetical protein SCP_1503120 [Sparassis crispa]GBE89304.1 hypothetical protein SCP_1503120 [Sparassis crispa]
MVLTHDFIVWDRHGRDTFLLDSEDTLQIAIKDEEGIMAINLARLTGALSMLPMAFYLCSNLTPSELIRGVTRQDGTVERLSADDLAACMEGRVRLTTANTVGNASIYLQNSPACSRRPLCADSFKRFLRIGLIFSPTDSISHHSLHQRDGSLNNICENDKVCWDCITFLMTSDYERRRKLWEILPSIFGLEDWKHLRAAESA